MLKALLNYLLSVAYLHLGLFIVYNEVFIPRAGVHIHVNYIHLIC